MTLRIAFLLPDMRAGGAERVALSLIERFSAQSIAIDLLLLKPEGELLSLIPSNVRIFDLNALRIRQSVLGVMHYLRREAPQAIQVSMWPLTVSAIVGHRLARSKSRLVVSDHVILSRQYGGADLLPLKATTRLLYPLATARVCVSQGVAFDLSNLSGIPARKIDVIYNPIPAPPRVIRRNSQLDALWGNVKYRILSVGNLKPEKNHALLIRSFAKTRELGNSKLMIVGDGELRHELEGLAGKLEIAEQVVFTGHILDLWPYYASADLFVLSSEYEGFGNVLVEAMHAGLPVVSTDCQSGPSEILNHGEFGKLVPVGAVEQLSSAIDDALVAPRAPERQQRRAREFNVDRAADVYLRLLVGSAGMS